jgi:hypothetical protein
MTSFIRVSEEGFIFEVINQKDLSDDTYVGCVEVTLPEELVDPTGWVYLGGVFVDNRELELDHQDSIEVPD